VRVGKPSRRAQLACKGPWGTTAGLQPVSDGAAGGAPRVGLDGTRAHLQLGTARQWLGIGHRGLVAVGSMAVWER
jgi:hypothetical protein